MHDPQIRVAGKESLRWLWLVGAVIVLDQLTKWMVVDAFELNQRINMAPFFDLVRLHNTGAAFSLFAEASGWQRWFFTALAFIVSVVIIWWQWHLPKDQHRILSLGLALILAGALGNVIDRMIYGYVIDFLLFYIGDYSWPAFNVADSAIFVGVVLVMWDHLILEKKRGGRRAADGDRRDRRASDVGGSRRSGAGSAEDRRS
ncbi:MAG: signal peptidase II [Gammaproteobacteria bacterium]|nr:signal peptidase II [Gammaproteobacteria bacterium]